MSEKLVERVKDVILAGMMTDVPDFAKTARAVLSAIEREGFKVVPVEPTLQMRKLCTFEQVEIDWPELLKASSPTR